MIPAAFLFLCVVAKTLMDALYHIISHITSEIEIEIEINWAATKYSSALVSRWRSFIVAEIIYKQTECRAHTDGLSFVDGYSYEVLQ